MCILRKWSMLRERKTALRNKIVKKNNFFMWAYITAIYLCIIVRIFADYAIWDSIVLAITVSSCFFALEDLFSVQYNFLKDSCDLLDNYITKAKANSEKDIAFFEKMQNKICSDPYIKKRNTDTLETCESFISLAKHTISSAESIERKIDRKRQKLKKYEKLADTMVYLGFLCLFCIVFFSGYISLSDKTLEIITVFSFAAIMATQQLKQDFAAMFKQESEEYQKMLSRDEMAERMNPDMERTLDEIIEYQNRIRGLEKTKQVCSLPDHIFDP